MDWWSQANLLISSLQGEDKVASNNRKPSYAHLLEVISTQEKIKTFSSGMIPLSGMELSANEVDVQKTEWPETVFKDIEEKRTRHQKAWSWSSGKRDEKS